MPKNPEERTNVSFQPRGRWMWKEESQTLEFISSTPAEEAVKRKKRQTNVSFRELQLRADWLAAVCSPNHRGRQSLKKSLSPAHLDAYRRSVKKKQQDHVTLEDVKEAAVALLQDNYLLPIPFCFLDVLKSEDLDGVLEALLLYLSCFFEHKTLEDKPASSVVTDIFSEHQKSVESLTKKQMSQKKLAVRYFSLLMDLQKERRPQNKGQMSSSRTEWLLHAILYSFLCLLCWVSLGFRSLKEIQEELGRLFYSDSFNRAMRNRSDEDSGDKRSTEEPEETRRTRTFRQRSSPRSPSLSSVLNQRSPLMVSLLPSPKQRSPHLFSGTFSSSQVQHVDTEVLMQQLDLQLDQQLEAGSFGILGKPLDELNCSFLLDQNNLRGDEDEDEDEDVEDDEDIDDKNNPPDPPGLMIQANDGSSRAGVSNSF